MCDSQEFVLLGELGNNLWVRCRSCGFEQTGNQLKDEIDEIEDQLN
jgi:hypothetical protein